ncbi:thiamine phosphate synthase [Rossellomorea oryzaecorticis]|uniref:Thiamine phosphate synthase n=1 Tax=Rossellomorea oryzaecorticis TaxID=1396505 RepID=A0ABU9K850_9BACI
MKKQLHAITTGQQGIEEMIRISLTIEPYVDFLHIREKSWTAREIDTALRKLVRGGFPADRIIVNDRVDVAVVEGAGGAHLSHHSLRASEVKKKFPFMTIGASVHSIDEGIYLQEKGADYLLYGNVFITPSKAGKPGTGTMKIQELVNAVNVPVIAIGGIKPGNVEDIIDSGAAGIAVLSGIFLAMDPVRSAKEYRIQLDRGEEC